MGKGWGGVGGGDASRAPFPPHLCEDEHGRVAGALQLLPEVRRRDAAVNWGDPGVRPDRTRSVEEAAR